MPINLLVGIDPGTRTGLAVYCPSERRLRTVMTSGIIVAMSFVGELASDPAFTLKVYFEDARLRTWFGKSGREKLQGAGSIKRDCAIWEEFLSSRGIDHESLKPASGATKWTQAQFSAMTGWESITSNHARDAALLVYGRKQ